MAENQYVNRVVFGNQVVIDISDSTVNANTLLAGYKAYGANGEQVTGNVTLSYHITLTQAQYDELSDQEKLADENFFYITDADPSSVQFIDDTQISNSKGWSSDKISKVISNPNLLDNPWFTINQRGQSSYSSTGNAIYTVDRWQLLTSLASVTVNSDNTITIQGQSTASGQNFVVQYIEYERLSKRIGSPITLSVMLSDGSIVYGSGVVKEGTSSWLLQIDPIVISNNCIVKLLSYSTSTFQVIISPQNTDSAVDVTIKAIKLELGSISTLALDTVPNYQQELAKCKRYFQKLRGDLLRVNTYTARLMFFLYPLEVEMRTVPAVVGTPIVKSMTAVTQTGFTFAYNLVNRNQAIQVVATKESHGLTDGYVNCGDDGLQLSADL